MEVRITKFDPRAVIPEYQTGLASAFDLTIIEETIVPPLQQTNLRTGLGFGIPEDHVLHIFSRSSTFKKFGVILANGVGIIDPDYSGPNDELHVAVINPGSTPITIAAGSRVAQGMIMPRPRVTFVEGPAGTADRGGFGTTGY
jgi:dUTP pyrophosphatase